MDGFRIAFLVLAALVVGALLPLLVQLHSVLHTLQQVLEKTSRDVEEGTKAVHTVASRLDRVTARLEDAGEVEKLVSSVAAISEMAGQLRDVMKVATAVGAAVIPAVGAAVRAWHSDPAPEAGSPGDRPSAVEGEDGVDNTKKEVSR